MKCEHAPGGGSLQRLVRCIAWPSRKTFHLLRRFAQRQLNLPHTFCWNDIDCEHGNVGWLETELCSANSGVSGALYVAK
jgi:hypothetical protein